MSVRARKRGGDPWDVLSKLRASSLTGDPEAWEESPVRLFPQQQEKP